MTNAKITKYRGRTIRKEGTSWQVDFGRTNGKRIQRRYKNKDAAKLAIDQFMAERAQEHAEELNKCVAVYDLTDRQRIDVILAMEQLPEGSTLAGAVGFYSKHTKPKGGKCTVNELLEEYIEAKAMANRRPHTLKGIRSRIGRLAKEFGDTPIHQITSHDLEKWLNKKKYRGTSRLNYRTSFVGFFNFAMRREYTQQNPALKIERPLLDETTPEIFTPKEAQRLMFAALEHGKHMVPYFAICLFAGLRPSETQHLDWKHINLKNKLITVRPEVAKKRRQRLVDISANLAQWLAPFRKEGGTVIYTRKYFERVRKKGKIQWAHDIMRHSYGSYYLAKHENASTTALQMGHQRTDILFNHYRELVTREAADEYWSISPRQQDKVIRVS